MVSNGVDVTMSDDAGRWELPPAGQPFVWVHRGAGYDCAAWYHRPGAEPITFQLAPSPTVRRRIGHITDLHVDTSDGVFDLSAGDCTGDRLLAVLAELRDGFGCDLVVATGDLTNRGASDDFTDLRGALDRSPLPVFHMPGNHDHYGDYFAPANGPAAPGLSGRRYEAQLGPRWWSITEAGMRIVAIDWYTWDRGDDADVQRAWLVADLGLAEPGTSVLVLSHDLMPHSFFEQLAAAAPHVTVIGSLSGHWHTARSGRVGGELHLNTGNPMFGSWDWSPPHARLLEFDGTTLSVETRALAVAAEHRGATFVAAPVPRPADPADRVRWRTSLAGVAHLGGPVVHPRAATGDLIVVGWRDEDRALGGVTALDADGRAVWTTTLGGAVVGRVAVAGDDVAAVTIDGRVVVLDVDTGATRWAARLDGRRGLWVCAAPLLTDDAVVVGSGPSFGGFDRRDGHLLWHRTDLGSHEMYPSYGDGLVDGERVVIGLPSIEPSMYALIAKTGETVWASGTADGTTPAGSLVGRADGTVFGLGHPLELFAVDAATGERRFRAPIEGRYTWAAPLVTSEGVVVMSGDAVLACLDADDGSQRWRVRLPAADAPGFAPYRGGGRSSITTPVLDVHDAGRCSVATTDGGVWTVALASGAFDRLVRLPSAVTAGMATAGQGLVVPTADGSLWNLDVSPG
jgi:outer membrane protein assembly factor BamB